MKNIKIDLIVGARPNFLKVASVIKAIQISKSKRLSYRLIHTGQHYDKNMSDVFFDQLKIPKPDVNFDVRSSTQAKQVGDIMVKYEDLLNRGKPSLCIVFGDVNSTLACSI